MSNALIITSVASMVDQFLLPSAYLLQDMGYNVTVACNFEKGSTCSVEKIAELKKILEAHNIEYIQVDFERNATQIIKNRVAYKQLLHILSEQKFDLIHCHSPVGGMLGRLAARKARKNGAQVLYTAHGFHFYKGAPLKNWLMYYPVEKFCSRFTDVLITINQEDYALAKKKMKSKKVEYVPGVGIDLSRFRNAMVDRAEKRREIGVPEDAFLLVSVGEVNENKNHQVIVKAMAKLNNPQIHYVIAGVGNQTENLINLSETLQISNQLHLLGYRQDINEIDSVADVCCFPSLREGLGLGAIEGMACGLPIITSNVHGINDYSEDGVTGYKCSPHDVDGFAESISKLVTDQDVRKKMSEQNKKLVERYSINEILPRMKSIYES